MKKQPPFYKNGVPKINPGQVTTGTSASTTGSEHQFKDTLNAGLNVASFLIPGGAIFKGAKALSKVFKLAKSAKQHKKLHNLTNIANKSNKIQKNVPRVTVDPKLKNLTSREQLNLHNRVNKEITQIKPTLNQSTRYTSIDKGKANFILTAMKKKS